MKKLLFLFVLIAITLSSCCNERDDDVVRELIKEDSITIDYKRYQRSSTILLNRQHLSPVCNYPSFGYIVRC